MDSLIGSFCLAAHNSSLERTQGFGLFRFSDKTDWDPFSVDDNDDDKDDDDDAFDDDDSYNDDQSRSFRLMIYPPCLIFMLLYFSAVHQYHQRYTRGRRQEPAIPSIISL